MKGQARFTYTEADMIAAQNAGWTWYAQWRNLLVAYLALVVVNGGFFVGMNAARAIATTRTDWMAAILGAAPETVLLFGLIFLSARNHARQVLSLNRTTTGAWSARELGGEHAWAWDADALQMVSERGRADIAWGRVGAWLDAPGSILLYPPGSRAFSFTLAERVLAEGWRDAPKLLIYPFGGYAVSLPKRALAAGDADRLVDVLRGAGVREKRRFGLIAAKGAGASRL